MLFLFFSVCTDTLLMQESQKVSETRDKIKAFLAAQGMIKGHTGSGHYGSEYDPDLPFLKLEDENIKTPSSSERSPTTALPRVIREAPRPIGPQESAIREQRAPWIGHYHGTCHLFLIFYASCET
jgi:hypothetical protein